MIAVNQFEPGSWLRRCPSAARRSGETYDLIVVGGGLSGLAAASPHTDAAILEAHRALGEVLERRAFPFLPRDTKSTRT